MRVQVRGSIVFIVSFLFLMTLANSAFAQCAPPQIVSEPQNVTVPTGQGATFVVQASGTSPLNYQWYLGIPGDITTPVGTNAPMFTTGPVTSPVDVWVQVSNACGTARSLGARGQADCFLVAPDISGPPVIGPGKTYEVSWSPVPGASLYEIQESTSPTFSSFNARMTRLTSETYVHDAAPSELVPWYYRVRVTFNCRGVPHGSVAISSILRVIIEAPPPPARLPLEGIQVMSPAGDSRPIESSFNLFPPEGVSRALFTATTDQPWLTVEPSRGEVTESGILITVTSVPVTLPEGTSTATLLLEFDVPASEKRFITANGSASAAVPVSASVVAKLTPIAKDTFPPDNTLIIPAVAHVDGGGAQFVSDVRIANTSGQTIRYQLTFTPTGANQTREGLRNSITVGPGQTAALNDIVKQWFGVGLIETQGATGSLEIRAENFSGKIEAGDARAAFATVGSSRTYAKTELGTFGQYIPALLFGQFIGKSGVSPTPGVLSLQQVSESPSFRTNLGLVEASGQPATVEVSVFDNAGGQPIAVFNESLLAHEHRQMNQYLASKGITLPDGRIEVRVLSDTGRVSAYASVIDNVTSDPLLVEPADLTQALANKLILPGVADIKTGQANWRSDMRIFNPDSTPVEAMLTFYPSGNPEQPVRRVMTIGSGEVLALDNLLEETFEITGTGAVHVEGSGNAGLVVTARTYDQREIGSYGQFIPAVNIDNSIGRGDRPLQVLQLEESERFRSNLGLVEVSGEPVTLEISTSIPGAASVPVVLQRMEANEFVQINSVISKRLGIDNAYNSRVTIRVVGGSGRVAAYGSIIDNRTQDPTYVPSQ